MSHRLKKLRSAVIRALTSLMVARPAGAGRDDAGAALVEYSLILGFVVLAGVALLLLIGGYVSGDMTNTARGFGG